MYCPYYKTPLGNCQFCAVFGHHDFGTIISSLRHSYSLFSRGTLLDKDKTQGLYGGQKKSSFDSFPEVDESFTIYLRKLSLQSRNSDIDIVQRVLFIRFYKTVEIQKVENHHNLIIRFDALFSSPCLPKLFHSAYLLTLTLSLYFYFLKLRVFYFQRIDSGN